MKEDNTLSQTTDAAAGSTAPDTPITVDSKKVPGGVLLEHILSSLSDDKAEEVVTIGLQGKSEIADHMVICSGRSTRQVVGISEKLTDRLKHDFDLICKTEGKDQGDWVLVDAGDVIVHIFRPEVREFYQLEQLWTAPVQAPENG